MTTNFPSVAWPAPLADSPITADVELPGSKSETNRELVLAALAKGESHLRGALRARDTELMMRALTALGATVVDRGEVIVVRGPLFSQVSATEPVTGPAHSALPCPSPRPEGATANGAVHDRDGGHHPTATVTIDCGLAGTVMRFVPPLAALCGRPVTFVADKQAKTRPIDPILQVITNLGGRVSRAGSDPFPFTVCGPLLASFRPHQLTVANGQQQCLTIKVDAAGSSQFVSAAGILAAALPIERVVLEIVGEVPSRPHLEMTWECLRRRGVTVSQLDAQRIEIIPAALTAADVDIEPDLSNAGPFLVAAVLTAGRVRIPRWPRHTTQAGAAWVELLRRAGATVTWQAETANSGWLTVCGSGKVNALTVDMSAWGELVPTLAALLAFASGPSHLFGIGHLRGHETDRLHALETELRRAGIGAQTDAQSLRIFPPSGTLRGAGEPVRLRTYHDHRMATFAAIIGLRRPVIVEDVTTVSKTMPTFPSMWQRLFSGDTTGGRYPQLGVRS